MERRLKMGNIWDKVKVSTHVSQYQKRKEMSPVCAILLEVTETDGAG
jgi:hypothetical protein